MNCERCKNEVEDFLYGELGEARVTEVRAHLGDCAVCAALRDEIERENEIFGRFYEQTAIEPAAEMWEAIRARINNEAQGQAQIKKSHRWWLERPRAGAFGLLAPAALRQAAFAALLVVLSVAATTMYLKLRENGPEKIANKGEQATPTRTPQQIATPSPIIDIPGANRNNSAPATTPPINRPAPPRRLSDQELMNRQIARAELEYQKAIRLLDQAIAKQRDRLDPAMIKQYESSLALIDDSIASSRRALRERPDDPTAGQFLLAAYAKKLDLMQDVAMK